MSSLCDSCGGLIPDADNRWFVLRGDHALQWHGTCDPPQGVALIDLEVPHMWEYRDE